MQHYESIDVKREELYQSIVLQTERAVPRPGQGWAGPGVTAVQQELAPQPPQHHGHQPRQEGHTALALFKAPRRSYVDSPLLHI